MKKAVHSVHDDIAKKLAARMNGIPRGKTINREGLSWENFWCCRPQADTKPVVKKHLYEKGINIFLRKDTLGLRTLCMIMVI